MVVIFCLSLSLFWFFSPLYAGSLPIYIVLGPCLSYHETGAT